MLMQRPGGRDGKRFVRSGPEERFALAGLGVIEGHDEPAGYRAR